MSDDYLTVDAEAVHQRVGQIQERLADIAVRPVTVVAITKRFGPSAIYAAVQAGLAHVGESYAQEMAAKVVQCDGAPVQWHFVGGLQRNKVRLVAEHVHLWQSVDRLRIGQEIAKRASDARVLVQVNAAGTEGQAGCLLADVPALVDQLRDAGLAVDGLMTIGAAGDAVATRDAFRKVRSTADRLSLPECSMGMSGDWEIAVQEGSTMIRLGSVLFGQREG